MELPKNRFKQLLRQGRQQIGLWNTLGSALVTELLGGSGFDWLCLDTEHSPNDVLTILPQLQALSASPTAVVVRPAWNDTVLIKRYLDIGVQTLLIPYVQNETEAKAAVLATRYPPQGVRGVSGTARATQFGRIKDYAETASAELCLLVQVETLTAIDRIEAIAEVDGVDGIFVGPGDLAASMGFAGQLNHPQLVAAVEAAIGRIVAAGKPAGILTTDPTFADRCIELGTTFTAVGLDAAILARESEKLAARFNRP